jgi:hypothetical protein
MLDMSAMAPCNGRGALSNVQRRLIGIDGGSFTHAKHAFPKGILHEIFLDNRLDWRSWNPGHTLIK